LRANRIGTSVVALALALVMGIDVSAHRRDEYLHAARIAVAPERVDVELDLTPGIALADGIIAEIDRNRDGVLSADEEQAYAGGVLSDVALEVDGRPLRLEPITSTFPELGPFQRGEGTIQLRVRALLPDVSDGAHLLLFRNAHDRDVSVYLANALVPESERVAITAQRRHADQSELTIDFVRRPVSATSPPLWLLWSVAGAAGLAGLLMRPALPTCLSRPQPGEVTAAARESASLPDLHSA
jgi:hypothetical protein